MGESAEFEKLTMLEARLAAALDRIGAGIRETAPRLEAFDDPGVTSAALEDATLRAQSAEAERDELRARVDHLEAQLSETQASLAEAQQEAAPDTSDASDGGLAAAEVARLAEERDELSRQVQALEAAREADRDEFNRALNAREADVETLRLELAERDAAPSPEPEPAPAPSAEDEAVTEELEALREEVPLLRMRVKRMRQQRQMARAELDEVKDALDEAQGSSAAPSDTRLLSMRGEMAQLRTANDGLMESLDALRAAAQPDITDWDVALTDQVAALQAARRSDAAELERILAELEPVLAAGGSNA